MNHMIKFKVCLVILMMVLWLPAPATPCYGYLAIEKETLNNMRDNY